MGLEQLLTNDEKKMEQDELEVMEWENATLRQEYTRSKYYMDFHTSEAGKDKITCLKYLADHAVADGRQTSREENEKIAELER